MSQLDAGAGDYADKCKYECKYVTSLVKLTPACTYYITFESLIMGLTLSGTVHATY